MGRFFEVRTQRALNFELKNMVLVSVVTLYLQTGHYQKRYTQAQSCMCACVCVCAYANALEPGTILNWCHLYLKGLKRNCVCEHIRVHRCMHATTHM